MEFKKIMEILNSISKYDKFTQFYIQSDEYENNDICVLGVYIDNEDETKPYAEVIVATDVDSYIMELLDMDCNIKIQPIYCSENHLETLKSYSGDITII